MTVMGVRLSADSDMMLLACVTVVAMEFFYEWRTPYQLIKISRVTRDNDDSMTTNFEEDLRRGSRYRCDFTLLSTAPCHRCTIITIHPPPHKAKQQMYFDYEWHRISRINLA